MPRQDQIPGDLPDESTTDRMADRPAEATESPESTNRGCKANTADLNQRTRCAIAAEWKISPAFPLAVPVLCQQSIDAWPGLEGTSPKPRGFLRSAQSSPGHPIHQSTIDHVPVVSPPTADIAPRRRHRQFLSACEPSETIPEYCRRQTVLSAEPFRLSLITLLPDDSAPRANEPISSTRQVAAQSWKTKLLPGIAVSGTEVRSREFATLAQHKSRRIHLFSRQHFSVCQSQASHQSVVDDCQWTTRRALFVSEI